MLYLTGNVKRIEDSETNRTFVRDENGDYYEELEGPLDRKYFRKLEIPLIVRRDIMEGVKGELLI
ncbi:MAG: hypothetical protein HYU56_04405 [Candidatus Aenigmarchaeota archaeon]|nr:hypothetical protein [Candidatus Aenigmarchaeota archaeon]